MYHLLSCFCRLEHEVTLWLKLRHESETLTSPLGEGGPISGREPVCGGSLLTSHWRDYMTVHQPEHAVSMSANVGQ